MLHRHTTHPYLVNLTWEQWTKDDVLTSCKNGWGCLPDVKQQFTSSHLSSPSGDQAGSQDIMQRTRSSQRQNKAVVYCVLYSYSGFWVMSSQAVCCEIGGRIIMWQSIYPSVVQGGELTWNTSGKMTNTAVWHDIQQHFVIKSCRLYVLLLFESLH